MLKWRKTLIFQGFVELGIEVGVGMEMLGNAYFIRAKRCFEGIFDDF